MSYRNTLNLMKTDFPQKAQLAAREPGFLERWEEMDLYGQIRRTRQGAETFILHDGPPYANGNIHLGTALNKTLKDIVVKHRTMKGSDAPYVPGWDCHGLPIENQVEKSVGKAYKELSTAEIREKCTEWAHRFIGIQCEDFKRLGVLGRWEEPYLTLNPAYEAKCVENFIEMYFKGGIFQKLKPVHWCMVHQTALAEAELEYKDHVSPTVHVAFKVLRGGTDLGIDVAAEDVSVVIWTTTPWTLPANRAIAVNPSFDYVVYKAKGKHFIVAEDLLETVLAETGLEGGVVKRLKGEQLVGVVTKHPFYDRETPIYPAMFVTAEQGTGLVHIAPGHGQDDYELGLKHDIEVYNPVDDGGIYKPDVEFFAGMHVFKANPKIIEHMRENGSLIADSEYHHQYPHSWRSKKPVIFRATKQWFVSMERNDLRKRALEWIDKVQWFPGRGRDRIYAMIENRPDWCISRQRTWGVPIALLLNKETGEPLQDRAVYENIINIIAEKGVGVWFTEPAEHFLPDGYKDPETGAAEFKKVMDILDVWFESGVSHDAVLNTNEELSWPADLYLEGSDQHRGWFHTSLLIGVGTKDRAPYKSVLTHGFVVDGDGRKMSKSLGNVIEPKTLIKDGGADVLRMWVASEDFRADIRCSPEIIKQAADSYRKIRNTMRFLLGNLADYDPATTVPVAERSELDRWVLHSLAELIEKVDTAYERFDLHIAAKALHQFCANELSSIYLDITRDRLYCEAADDPHRRAIQATIYDVAHVLARLWAPVCPFTAEESWDFLPGDKAQSVHLEPFPVAPAEWRDEDLAGRWGRIFAMREVANLALEAKRKEKTIGKPLDAHLTLYATANDRTLLGGFGKASAGDRHEFSLGDELPWIFGVSLLEVKPLAEAPEDAAASEEVTDFKATAAKAGGQKCERCWTYHTPFENLNQTYGDVCSRCLRVLTR